jgi:hydrogenase expression/formation protein HypC
MLDGDEVALVDVVGVVREINLGLLDGPFQPDEYILIHSGFALERMTAEQARDALAVFADGDAMGAPDPVRS